jgi:hypothetical protein
VPHGELAPAWLRWCPLAALIEFLRWLAVRQKGCHQ